LSNIDDTLKDLFNSDETEKNTDYAISSIYNNDTYDNKSEVVVDENIENGQLSNPGTKIVDTANDSMNRLHPKKSNLYLTLCQKKLLMIRYR